MDRFRKEYRELNPVNKSVIHAIKEQAEELEKLISLFSGREISIALTKLEESVMWATKGIVLYDERTKGGSRLVESLQAQEWVPDKIGVDAS